MSSSTPTGTAAPAPVANPPPPRWQEVLTSSKSQLAQMCAAANLALTGKEKAFELQHLLLQHAGLVTAAGGATASQAPPAPPAVTVIAPDRKAIDGAFADDGKARRFNGTNFLQFRATARLVAGERSPSTNDAKLDVKLLFQVGLTEAVRAALIEDDAVVHAPTVEQFFAALRLAFPNPCEAFERAQGYLSNQELKPAPKNGATPLTSAEVHQRTATEEHLARHLAQEHAEQTAPTVAAEIAALYAANGLVGPALPASAIAAVLVRAGVPMPTSVRRARLMRAFDTELVAQLKGAHDEPLGAGKTMAETAAAARRLAGARA